MITNVPPWVKSTSALNAEDLAHHSRAVADPPDFDPAYVITSNFNRVLQSALFRGKHDNSANGKLFEICFWNALVTYGVDPGLIECHKDISNGKNAEIDLLVHAPMDPVALLVKTSLRERWKQVDRDANIIRIFDATKRMDIWVVFHREYTSDTAEKAISRAVSVQQMLGTGGVSVRSAMDTNAMRTLFIRCGATVTNDLSVTSGQAAFL